MARELKEYSFGMGASHYNFDRWANGKILLLEQGTDFETKPRTMRRNLRAWGKKNGYTVRTGYKGCNEKQIIVQVTPKDQPVKVAKPKREKKVKAEKKDQTDVATDVLAELGVTE